MTEQAARRINWLLERYETPSYLEIGVFRGQTFFKINAAKKVAVDPKFQFDIPPSTPGVEFHETTSDAYFADIAQGTLFDVVFLDGLHTFEQTFRDFCNAVLHTHAGSVIVIDDTVPSDPFSALRDQRQAAASRAEHGSTDKAWHGDTYKTIFAIHDLFPAYSYATVMDDGNPQTAVWRAPRHVDPAFERIEQIGRADYFEFRRQLHLLNPITREELITMLGRDLPRQEDSVLRSIPLTRTLQTSLAMGQVE